MTQGERQYRQFCQGHDDTAECTDFRDDALRQRGIDPSSSATYLPTPGRQ
jgi:hypothetical protein